MEYNYLKSYLIARIENLSDIEVYDGCIPDDDSAVYPCVSVVFPPLEGEKERFSKDNITVDLNFYDDTNNDTAIITAAEKVRRGNGEYIGLDCSVQNENEGFYRCDIKIGTTEIIEEENNLSRVFQSYLLQVG